jgi:hypothetical protein
LKTKTASFLFFALLIVASCKKDEQTTIRFDVTEITLHHAKTAQITVTPAQGGIWSTADSNVATVSQTGLVTGVRLGDTKVTLVNGKLSAECIVHCTPTSTFYKEPYFYYGQSKAYIKLVETRTLYTEATNSLEYKGENSNIAGVLYTFSNLKLESALVGFKYDNNNVTKAAEFIEERYIYVGLTGSVVFFKDGKGTYLGLSILPDPDFGYNVLYYHSTFKNNEYQKQYFKQIDKFINVE